MKKIPPNFWRDNLTEDDWNFSQVQNDEWPQCLCRELAREQTQSEGNGNFPAGWFFTWTSEDERALNRLSVGRALGLHIGGDLAERLQKAKLGKHEKHDWTPYISQRRKENWKSLPKHPPEITYSFMALDWRTLMKYWGDEVEDASRCMSAPAIMDGEKIQIVPFKIPWNWRNDEIIDAFARWVKENRPKGEKWSYEFEGTVVHWADNRPRIDEPPPSLKSKVGAGSYIRQVKTLLKQLAAWRLIQRYNGSRIKARAHPGAKEYLGESYTNNDGDWTDARKAVEAALKQLHRVWLDAEKFASTKKE
jgi:hypothetical protein